MTQHKMADVNNSPQFVGCGLHGPLVVKVNTGLAIGGGVLVSLMGILVTLLYQTFSLVPTVKMEVLDKLSTVNARIEKTDILTASLAKELDRLRTTRNNDHPKRTPVF